MKKSLFFLFAALNLSAQVPIGSISNGGAGGTGSNSLSTGTYANLPATCAVGAEYKQSDGPYDFVCTSLNTFTAFIPSVGQITVPPSTGWTSVNFGTTTADSTNGYRYFTGVQANTNAHGLRVQTRTAPATPYAISAGIRHDASAAPPGVTNTSHTGWWGLIFGDGTKFIAFMVGINGAAGDFFDSKYTNSTTLSAAYVDQPTSTNWDVVEAFKKDITWLCETDDGTNLTWFWSIDRQHWKQFDQRLRGDFLTTAPNVIGWGGDPLGNTQELQLLDWTVNTAATCK